MLAQAKITLAEGLPKDTETCHALIVNLADELEKTKHHVRHLLRIVYGRSSEKLTGADSEFFGGVLGEAAAAERDKAAADAQPEAPAAAANKPGHGRRPLSPRLKRQRVEHDASPEEKFCTQCACDKKRIGEIVSEKLDFIPASFFVTQHVRAKYACPCCQGGVVSAAMPLEAVDKCLAAPGLLAYIAVSKYADHLPLNRLETIIARHGVDLKRSTLCDWIMSSAAALEPLVKEIWRRVLASKVIHSDDTPVSVQMEGKTGKCHRGFVWVYAGDQDNPYTAYDFSMTRSASAPEAILKDYHGYLQADAYAGYDGLYASGNIIEAGCWAHARRKFHDATDSDRTRANHVLAVIGKLYGVERDIREVTDFAQRARIRRERAGPVMEELRLWLEENLKTTLPKSPLGQAIGYARNHWQALVRYLDEGRLSIDNNAAERAMRPLAVGRKNWLFAGSQRGARAAAIFYTLIESAKRAGIDPLAYLRDILTRLPAHPHKQIGELLPDNWKAALETQAPNEQPVASCA